MLLWLFVISMLTATFSSEVSVLVLVHFLSTDCIVKVLNHVQEQKESRYVSHIVPVYWSFLEHSKLNQFGSSESLTGGNIHGLVT